MKTNNLKHRISKTFGSEHFEIDIRLNDECKNGHQDFAITCSIYEAGKPRSDRYFISGGCCHEEILRVMPSLKNFVDLHLSDVWGVPMYAIANGFYHLKDKSKNDEQVKNTVMEYLRISADEFEVIKMAEDETYFTFILEKLGIPARWRNEADKAIKVLEEMTGNEFVNDSTKQNYKPVIEKLAEVENLIQSGFYQPEKIQEREQKKIADKKANLIAELIKERDKEIENATVECQLKLWVIESGLNVENVIYYTHTKQLTFNWNTSPYNKEVTKDEFEKFLSFLSDKKIPEGVTVNIK